MRGTGKHKLTFATPKSLVKHKWAECCKADYKSWTNCVWGASLRPLQVISCHKGWQPSQSGKILQLWSAELTADSKHVRELQVASKGSASGPISRATSALVRKPSWVFWSRANQNTFLQRLLCCSTGSICPGIYQSSSTASDTVLFGPICPQFSCQAHLQVLSWDSTHRRCLRGWRTDWIVDFLGQHSQEVSQR